MTPNVLFNWLPYRLLQKGTSIQISFNLPLKWYSTIEYSTYLCHLYSGLGRFYIKRVRPLSVMLHWRVTTPSNALQKRKVLDSALTLFTGHSAGAIGGLAWAISLGTLSPLRWFNLPQQQQQHAASTAWTHTWNHLIRQSLNLLLESNEKLNWKQIFKKP